MAAAASGVPRRSAEFSRSRRRARWVPDPVAPAPSASAFRALGALKPSRLESTQFSTRGGAALDAHGYAWGQNVNECWAHVPLPPGCTRRHVKAKMARTSLHARVDPAVADTVFGRAVAAASRSDDGEGLRAAVAEPVLLADFHAPIDVDGGSQWYMDEQKARTKGPVPPLVHKVLIINVRKAEAAWWPRFFVGHPTIVRRDFPFMADDDR